MAEYFDYFRHGLVDAFDAAVMVHRPRGVDEVEHVHAPAGTWKRAYIGQRHGVGNITEARHVPKSILQPSANTTEHPGEAVAALPDGICTVHVLVPVFSRPSTTPRPRTFMVEQRPSAVRESPRNRLFPALSL